MSYITEEVRVIAESILEAGFRAFIAKTMEYGYFTNAEGTRVVSFSGGMVSGGFSGNYKSPYQSGLGSGWRLSDNLTYEQMLNAYPPDSITRGIGVTMSTEAQHRERYQSSSQYRELVKSADEESGFLLLPLPEEPS